ncbi:hypothetical protein AQI95_01810 [Streptomyces yokosukanensis]|uniref:NADPH-dependent FMN reductase-like domain-containing protein n=1 Tax=Streptomyces yokosukanensis TaxID=67386 RepID=A0A117Q638_9ACTN|nr:NADPH-dependent FMN reductase [Streptomyces yokosukanensis]KUN10479.1 hypothetical protein AQI95_01810 [Streptomyces yokosukanensis]
MAKIVLLSGSVRRDSLNAAVLRTVRRLVHERPGPVPGGHDVAVLEAGRLPLYDGDLEQSGGTAVVEESKDLVRDADALFISTPSYNGEMPGALKNALDWLSRPSGDSPLAGLTVAVLSASPGARGALDAQPALTGVLARCGAHVVDHEPVAIGNAHELRRADGEFTEPSVVAALGGLVDATLAALPRPAVAHR